MGGFATVRLLLDTHVLLWSVLAPDKLSPPAAAVLEDPANELWLSPVTSWEICLLAERGRIAIHSASPEEWLRGVLARVPVKEASLNHEVALRSRTVDLEHQDPADRFIAATALVYDLILLTTDERLLRSAHVRTMRV